MSEQTENEIAQVPADPEAESTEMPETATNEDTGMSTTAKILIGALVGIALCAVCAVASIILLNWPGEPEPTAGV